MEEKQYSCWEYKDLFAARGSFEEALNDLGRKGWELVGFSYQGGYYSGILKRKIQD
jgi:hypothetical protein